MMLPRIAKVELPGIGQTSVIVHRVDGTEALVEDGHGHVWVVDVGRLQFMEEPEGFRWEADERDANVRTWEREES